jgi:hypothetical protein
MNVLCSTTLHSRRHTGVNTTSAFYSLYEFATHQLTKSYSYVSRMKELSKRKAAAAEEEE